MGFLHAPISFAFHLEANRISLSYLSQTWVATKAIPNVSHFAKKGRKQALRPFSGWYYPTPPRGKFNKDRKVVTARTLSVITTGATTALRGPRTAAYYFRLLKRSFLGDDVLYSETDLRRRQPLSIVSNGAGRYHYTA